MSREDIPALLTSALGSGREYLGTFLVQFVVLLGQLAVYKLAAYYFGGEGFAEYAVVRRTISLIQPILWLGLGVALPRYLAFSSVQSEEAETRPFYGAALLIMGCATLFVTVVMNLAQGPIALALFGSKNYNYLVFPMTVMLFGLGLHAAAYSYFRGKMAIAQANWLDFVNSGILPVAVILGIHQSVTSLLLSLGVLWTLVSMVALTFTPWREARQSTVSEAKELLAYGLPRVPGDLILVGLMTLPTTLVAHKYGLTEAGFVAFGTSMLNMVGAAFAPISIILLPKASRMLGQGAKASLRTHVTKLVIATLICASIVTGLVTVFAETLVRRYLGLGFLQAGVTIRIAALGVVPYCLYIILRGLIDAYHEKAVNTRNLAFAIGSFLLLAGSTQLVPASPNSVMMALVMGLTVLGLLTSIEATRILVRE